MTLGPPGVTLGMGVADASGVGDSAVADRTNWVGVEGKPVAVAATGSDSLAYRAKKPHA